MAHYKFERFLKFSADALYDKPLLAGAPAPRSGIYRCDGCGLEITALSPNPLPPEEHHPHVASQKKVRWKLIVADGGQAGATDLSATNGSMRQMQR